MLHACCSVLLLSDPCVLACMSRRGVKMRANQSTRRTWSPCRCSAQNPHQRLCGRERTSCSRSTAGRCPRSRAWAGAAGVNSLMPLSEYARANARMACVFAIRRIQCHSQHIDAQALHNRTRTHPSRSTIFSHDPHTHTHAHASTPLQTYYAVAG